MALALSPALAPAPRRESAIEPRLLVLLLFFLGVQPLSTDLYLPSLPALATGLDQTAAGIQWTLSAFMAAFALSQLGVGPLSDRFGRRPVVIAGLLVYVASTFAALLAGSLGVLIAARVGQALGVCCTVLSARAIVRDVYEPEAGTRIFGRLLGWMSLITFAGPTTGGLLIREYGWRAAFAALLAVGLALLAAAWHGLPETNRHRNRDATRTAPLLANYAAILRSHPFRMFTLSGASSFAAIFSFISSSSFVLVEVMGVPVAWYGLAFGAVTLGFLPGSLLLRPLQDRWGLASAMAAGALLQAAGGAVMLAFALGGRTDAAAVIGPMLLVLVGHGILQPTSQMGAIGAFPRQAGAAAALFGFTLNLVAALVGGWLGSHFNGTAVPMAIGVFAAGLVGSLTCLGPIRRITRPLLRTTTGLGALSLSLMLCLATPEASAQGSGAALAPEVASGRVTKSVGFGQHDLVVAAHPLAVEAGVEMLAAGGSALDAAIAAQWMLGLVEPQSSGLGGGALMLHRGAAGRIEAWDGRETAPAAARGDQMLDGQGKALPKPASIDNGLSVGVPGVVAMLEAAHRRHGRLPWARLVEPALRVAEEGFPISPRLHTQIRSAQARIRAQGEPIASYFLDAQGNPRPAGERLRNPEYARTLRLLARDGARVFHDGEIAQAIVDKVRAHPVRPGVMTLEDLRAYRPRVREPVCGPYRGLRLCTAPPPSAGGIAILQILGMLEGTPSPDLSMRTPEGLHRITEAQRLAWADRTRHVADDQFIAVPVAGLLAPAYLRERADRIRPERSLGSVEAGQPEGAVGAGADGHEGQDSTTHLSIVDARGAAVSLTSSIEAGFGSLQMVRGFLLNNQLTDFSPQTADAQGRLIANRLEPGKRPRSAMSPTFVLDAEGRLEAALGSPGGPAIVHYLSQTLIGLIDGALPLQQAIDQPHFGAMNGPLTFLEKGGFDDAEGQAIVSGLKARGHRVREFELNSGLHVLVFNGRREDGQPGRFAVDPDRGRWAGAADSRREGVARGSP